MENITSKQIGLNCSYVLKLPSKDNEEQERTKTKKKIFLQYLEKSRGIVTLSCEKTGVARSTFYHWRKHDKEFRSATVKILNCKIEILEDRLYTLALEGEFPALAYILNRAYKRRDKKDSKNEVHIYHHVGNRPGVEPPVTLEDIMRNPDLWDSYVKWLRKRNGEATPPPFSQRTGTEIIIDDDGNVSSHEITDKDREEDKKKR